MSLEKLAILKEIFGRYHREGEGQYLFYCPVCKHHKPKLSINLGRGGKCWICETKSPNLRYFVKRFGTKEHLKKWDEINGYVDLSSKRRNPLVKEQEEEKYEKVTLPEEFKTLTSEKQGILSSPARKYLSDRGIAKEDIFKWKIGYADKGQYKDRVIFPSFNLKGDLDFFIARTYVDAFRKYLTPKVCHDTIIFNELFFDWSKDIVLVEGVFDAVVAENAIPLLGSTLKENSLLFKRLVSQSSPVFLALDVDAEKKENKIGRLLGQYGVDVYKIEVDPFNDVGEMSKKEFQSRKGCAITMNRSSMLKRKMFGVM